jgi:uncharacterized protein HemY
MDAEAEAESFRLQGNERFREQRWGAAEQAYKEALRRCPSAAVGSNLAATLLKLGR